MRRRLQIVGILLGVSIMMTACGNKEEVAVEQNSNVAAIEEDNEESVSTVTEETEDDNDTQDFMNEGFAYLTGKDGKDRNLNKALETFKKADEAGNEKGSFMCGWIYSWELDDGVGKDFKKAKEYFEKCDEDNILANICLGNLHYYGNGVDKNIEIGSEYWDKAGEYLEYNEFDIGDMDYVAYLIGKYFDDENNIWIDNEKAVHWYEIASEAGNYVADYMLGYCYENESGVKQDYAKALEMYNKAAEKDYYLAYERLSGIYKDGICGQNVDSEKSLQYAQKAYDVLFSETEKGNSEAMYRICKLYKNEYMGKIDYDKVIEWYVKAAEANNVTAIDELANIYYSGEFNQKADKAKSLELYEKAMDLGSASATNSVGVFYFNGDVVKKDYKKAVELFEKAANAGSTSGMYDMGYSYTYGYGVDKDYKKAAEWFDKALDYGYDRDGFFPKDRSGEYDTYEVEGAVGYEVIWDMGGSMEGALWYDESDYYTPEQYRALKKDKEKWYGAFVEVYGKGGGSISTLPDGRQLVVGTSSWPGIVMYK